MRKTLFINTLVVLTSLLLCFSLSEFYFRFVYIESDGLGLSLSQKKWLEKYWKPINSFDFRDKEWSKNELKSKKTIALVGDSVVAGHGIENVKDRFADILASNLGNKYAVVNLANPGWGTQTEWVILKLYPHDFDTIIWSYFPNDILDTANQLGRKSPCEISNPDGLLGRVIQLSHFLNFAYWNIYRATKLNDEYFDWLKSQYDDKATWSLHKQELELVANFVKDKNLIIIIFPFLNKMEESLSITNKVKNYFNAKGVKVVDVYQLASNLNKQDLVVSKIDAHPSKKLHHLIGNKLYKTIKDSEI
ncbi:MAG: SGNH/GDSL hydrolase family protein [Candidatus Melainabacteria bacterium]|nr:SGNH/GDSL hydrolase family protein [Candidatus Melainabacteria bacterium]